MDLRRRRSFADFVGEAGIRTVDPGFSRGSGMRRDFVSPLERARETGSRDPIHLRGFFYRPLKRAPEFVRHPNAPG
jgi:hypothetical protein